MSKKPPAIDAMHPVDKILFPIMIELHGAFSQIQEKLADYIDYLKETTSAKEKIENELSIAQEILLSMTPHSFPPFPNLPQVDLYATLSNLLRTIATKVKSTRNLVNILNKSFAMNNESFMFVTFFMGILDLKTGTVNYVNAGHTPPHACKEKQWHRSI